MIILSLTDRIKLKITKIFYKIQNSIILYSNLEINIYNITINFFFIKILIIIKILIVIKDLTI